MLELYGRNRGSCSSGGVWCTAKRDSTGYCSSPPSTPSSLHRLLFIHCRPPLASTCDCSSTCSWSSSLHRVLLHRLLFKHPSPRAPVQPPLHGLLFILPSTFYCSSCPPRGGPVHPALHGVLFIQPQLLDRSGSCSSRGNTTGSCSSTPTGNWSSKPPQQRSLIIQRQHRSASVSSSSEGVARSLEFSNA